MPAAVATRYARALVELATKPGEVPEPERVLEELALFEEALAVSPALRNVLLSPAVPAPQKRSLISRLVRHLGCSDLVRRFLLVVADRRRMGMLTQIRQAVEQTLDERLGVVRVEVTSARELTPAQREALEAALARVTGLRPRTRFRIEPELIGGAMARIGSTIYDGSVRGRLEALKRRLAGLES
ncbi:MAG: ATP synthase F1 subunit delta [Bryobacterales bacterium]|nr:ATP synthase F1 subunit delta [Bryobacteraceae bacterium]MDW8130243.1 ATP synthase F1 subunit delta [Bryobacterales bacterium]